MPWFKKKDEIDDLVKLTTQKLKTSSRGSYVQSGVAHIASDPHQELVKKQLSEVMSKAAEQNSRSTDSVLSEYQQILHSKESSTSYEHFLKDTLDLPAAAQTLAIAAFQIYKSELETYTTIVSCLREYLKNKNLGSNKPREVIKTLNLNLIKSEELSKSGFSRVITSEPKAS
jgi:hypothetical protein